MVTIPTAFRRVAHETVTEVKTVVEILVIVTEVEIVKAELPFRDKKVTGGIVVVSLVRIVDVHSS